MEVFSKILIGLIIAAGAVFVIAGIGLIVAWPVKWTWNATMPYLFSLPTITWGKAWCLNFLAGCLLKGTSSSSSK